MTVKPERTEHEIDIEFGQWLRDRREQIGLNINDAAKLTGIPLERLKSLELGYAGKSITSQEAKKAAVAYKLDLTELLDRAVGNK